MSLTVKVEGLRELERNLAGLTKAAGKGALRRAGTKALAPMADLAASFAPDDPNTPPIDLGTSIEVSTRLDKRLRKPEAPALVELYMGPTKPGYPQAIMQEFGTIYHAPQPYMRPAWDQDKDALLARVGIELRKEIDKSVQRAIRKRARQAARR